MWTRKWVAASSAAVLTLALAGGAAAVDGAAGGQAAGQPAGQQQAMAEIKNAIKVSKLDGMKVSGPDGEEVGEISEAFVDPASGQLNYVVLSKGGTLGIGGEEYLVPWDRMNIDLAQDMASVNVPGEQWAAEFSAYEEDAAEQDEEAREQMDRPQQPADDTR